MYNLFCNKKNCCTKFDIWNVGRLRGICGVTTHLFFQGILERTIRLLKSLLTLKFAEYMWKVKREETLQKYMKWNKLWKSNFHFISRNKVKDCGYRFSLEIIHGLFLIQMRCVVVSTFCIKEINIFIWN